MARSNIDLTESDKIESEFEFNKWLESIEFVNKEGHNSKVILFDDESSDPELDRGE